MPDDVQPQEGQGTEATPGIFDAYLSEVPETWDEIDRSNSPRSYVADYLKNTSGKLEGRVRESADIIKTYQPFSQIQGLENYNPQELSELLAWHQSITDNPEAYEQWVGQEAEAKGWTRAEVEQNAEEQAFQDLSPEQIRQIAQEEAQQGLQPFEQRFSEWEQEQAVKEMENIISDEFHAIEAESGRQLSKEERDVIMKLGRDSSPDSATGWVKEGFDAFQNVFTSGERALFDEKQNQPPPAMPKGGAETFKPPTTWDGANEAAKEFLRGLQSNQ